MGRVAVGMSCNDPQTLISCTAFRLILAARINSSDLFPYEPGNSETEVLGDDVMSLDDDVTSLNVTSSWNETLDSHTTEFSVLRPRSFVPRPTYGNPSQQVYNMLITSLFLLFVLTTVSLLIFLLMRRPPCCGPCRDSYQDAHTPSQANGNSSAVPVTYMTESHGIVVKKKILDSPPPYESPPDYQSLAPELIMDAKTLLQLAAASSSSSSSPVASIPPSASATPPPTAAVTPCLSRLHHTADVTTITNTTQETSFLDSNPEERCVVPSEPTRHHQALLPPPTYESVVYIPEDGNRPMAYQTKDHIPSDSVVTKSEMMTTIVACDVLTEPPQQQHVEHS